MSATSLERNNHGSKTTRMEAQDGAHPEVPVGQVANFSQDGLATWKGLPVRPLLDDAPDTVHGSPR